MKTFLRIAIAFLLPMLLPAVTAAQEPAVKRVCSDPIDLSAAKYLRKDLNDKACALVKVQIVADGVEFFGNTVGSVERKAGEKNNFGNGHPFRTAHDKVESQQPSHL